MKINVANREKIVKFLSPQQRHTNIMEITITEIAKLVGAKYSPLESYKCEVWENEITITASNGFAKSSITLIKCANTVCTPTITPRSFMASEPDDVKLFMAEISLLNDLIGDIKSAYAIIKSL